MVKITTNFNTHNGTPKTGLTPKITIYDISDLSSISIVVSSKNMTEIGDGLYGYDFTIRDSTIDYIAFINADTGTLNLNRYRYINVSAKKD